MSAETGADMSEGIREEAGAGEEFICDPMRTIDEILRKLVIAMDTETGRLTRFFPIIAPFLTVSLGAFVFYFWQEEVLGVALALLGLFALFPVFDYVKDDEQFPNLRLWVFGMMFTLAFPIVFLFVHTTTELVGTWSQREQFRQRAVENIGEILAQPEGYILSAGSLVAAESVAWERIVVLFLLMLPVIAVVWALVRCWDLESPY